jgi:hypothetical protein
VVILAGDVEYGSWSHITEELPRLERTEASLRIEIERKLREISRQRSLGVADQKISLRRLLNTLHSKNIIATQEFNILNRIIDVCNRAVHTERVDTETASEILDVGESTLSYLDSILRPPHDD